MTEYLSYKFEDSPEFVSTFDEAPLWSAHFGILLLKHLEYRTGITILDIGSGAGFPLIELAARYGSTCKCYGLDIWTNANARARQKVKNYGLRNVEIIEGSGDHIPLGDNSIDLVVSNLGINNFEDPAKVFGECARVLKPGGKLCLATNVNGHWQEFYDVFETTLQELGKDELLPILRLQQERRGSVAGLTSLYIDAGFLPGACFAETFLMKFADGSAFLNHYFVKVGWLGSWLSLAGDDAKEIFTLLELRLNELAERSGGLTLTVPAVFMEGVCGRR